MFQKKCSICIGVFFIFFNNSIIAQKFILGNSKFFIGNEIMSRHSNFADMDNNGDLNLFSTSIYNRDNQIYNLVENKFQFQKSFSGGNSNGIIFSDVDRDGLLEAFVFNIFGQKNDFYKTINNKFEKLSGLYISQSDNNSFSSSFCDFDNDGDPDLLITNTELWTPTKTNKKNQLFQNDGQGNFYPYTKFDFSVPKVNTRGSAWGDCNNDGFQDLYLCNFGSPSFLLINTGDGKFFKTTINNRNDDSIDAEWVDIDSDADLDLYIVNVNQSNRLYINNGEGILEESDEDYFNNLPKPSGSALFRDFNIDGFPDLFGHSIDDDYTSVYLINKGNSNNFISIKLRGLETNFFGIGTKIEVSAKINGKIITQYKEVQSKCGGPQTGLFDLNFGLKDANEILEIIIKWPSGKIKKYKDLKVNQFLCFREDGSYIKLDPTALDHSRENILNDLSIELFSDSITENQYTSISLFIENKGSVQGPANIIFEYDTLLTYKNSFPAPSISKKGKLEWNFGNLKPGERIIISNAFKSPLNFPENKENIYLKSFIYPINYDERKEDNTSEKSQKIWGNN